MKNLRLTFTNVDNLFDFVSCLQKEFTLFPAIQEINLIRQSVFGTQIDQDTLPTSTRRERERERERQDVQTYRQTDRQTDRQTGQTDRRDRQDIQTDRQT